jgi:hypothetical protein
LDWVKEDIMATGARPVIDLSQVSEILEVANSILHRHHDHELAQKTFVLQQYLEVSRTLPGDDYSGMIQKGLDDLTATVHLHLKVELEAAASAFDRFAS